MTFNERLAIRRLDALIGNAIMDEGCWDDEHYDQWVALTDKLDREDLGCTNGVPEIWREPIRLWLTMAE